MPLNVISENISYKKSNNENLRVIVSALIKEPQTWQVSKVENTNEIGIQIITLYQDAFNPHTDYVNLETKEMYADYYYNSSEPKADFCTDNEIKTKTLKIGSSTNTIKIGGSYKMLTASVFDENNIDITENYCDAVFEWDCSIKYDELDNDKRTWLYVKEYNKIKLKFSNDRSYLGKILEVRCKIILGSEILSSSTDFNLIV